MTVTLTLADVLTGVGTAVTSFGIMGLLAVLFAASSIIVLAVRAAKRFGR